MCVHNAGRSQMAAALLAHHGAGRVVVRSAGSTPAGSVNPAVVAALAEAGFDIAQEFPKPLTDEAVRASDVVITMGCGDACPIYPGKRYLNWDLDVPRRSRPRLRPHPQRRHRRTRPRTAGRAPGLTSENSFQVARGPRVAVAPGRRRHVGPVDSEACSTPL
ncbi:hypothetical protein GCM10009830_34730 [Glycomyces endophyticus]|uniref:Phosphotyrosine protein phosphatase I domain-containing protein n=1 Tax=Glycomyces endophyticus TaxID=480996 RepID=A0ABN2HA40_9ACTN